MAYRIKPNYHFKSKTETGIDEVPVGRVVVVEDFDGSVKTFTKTDNTGLTPTSTIEDAANASLLVEMGGAVTQASMMAYS